MIWPTGRQYGVALGIFTVVEFLSWFAYQDRLWQDLSCLAVVLALVIVAWKKPSWLAYAAIGELVIGGKGYLFFTTFIGPKLSIRMIIFTILVARALPLIIQHWRSLRSSILTRSVVLFIFWLGISQVTALIRGIAPSAIFSDANAFLYLAALPAWWLLLRIDPQWKQRVVSLLLAGASIIGLESWLMVLLFGRDISVIHQVYSWIRNTGIGEITYINNNVYRVFFQSQIYSLITFLFTFVVFVRERTPRWWLLPMCLSALGLYISLSRSFWLGLSIAFFVFVFWLLRRRQWQQLTHVWIIVPIALFSWAMMVWAISWPQFTLHGSTSAVSSRLQGSASGDAATARRNQIQPLLTAIGRHPIWGSGFGQSVTYFSTDPTVHGWRTTTAFELGYLDLWLKIGLVGLGLYAFWIIGLWRKIRTTIWAGPMIIAGVALVTVHLTTPYLNHPLGLGWFMLTTLFAYDPS